MNLVIPLCINKIPCRLKKKLYFYKVLDRVDLGDESGSGIQVLLSSFLIHFYSEIGDLHQCY